jgi:O-antigen/teichoic acid export membrane protein
VTEEAPDTSRSTLHRRATWSFLDQALSSVTNFLLSIAVARTVSPREFGAFGLVFATYLLLLNLTRALGSQPLLIRFSASPYDDQRKEIPGATGVAVVIGVVFGVILALASIPCAHTTKVALLALAITLPGLMLQDGWRFVFFAVARPAAAAVNDGIWAIFQVTAFVALRIHGAETAAPYVLGWGVAATVAAGFGIVQTRVWPSLVAGVRWLVAHRDIGPYLSLEFFATSATAQLTLFCVAPFVGLTGVASLRAAQVALGPLGVIYTAILIVAVPELTRIYVRDPARMPRVATLFALVSAASAVIVGAAIYFLPDSIGVALLRDNWEPAQEVIIPSALGLAFSALMTGPFLQMRVVEAVKETLKLRVWLLVAAVGLATLGAAAWGAKGAAWAVALVTAVFVWLSWLQARAVLATRHRVAVDPTTVPL